MASEAQVLAIKAMDGLYMRASAIAENIANGNSASFHVKSVDFETALRRAAAEGPDAVRDFRPTMSSAPQPIKGDDIRIDLEMANASATALRYSALADLLNRHMQITRLAVRGGQ